MRPLAAVFGSTVFLILSGCSGDSSSSSATDNAGTILCTGLSLGFVNMGAEEFDPSPLDDQFGILNSAWEKIVGNTSSTPYGLDDYPIAGEEQGTRLFTGGSEAVSVAQQTVAITADAVGCSFDFSADIGGFDSQEDNATVELLFLGSSGDVLSTSTLGPVTSEDRLGERVLLPLETSGTIPDTAVQAQIKITQNRLAGAANDGYVDNIAVTLN